MRGVPALSISAYIGGGPLFRCRQLEIRVDYTPYPAFLEVGPKDLKVRLPLSEEKLDESAIRLLATGFP